MSSSPSIKMIQSLLAKHRHRLMVVLSGQASWVEEEISKLDAISLSQEVLWVDKNETKVIQAQHLGHEYDAVVMDLSQQFSPNLLGALSGTVRAGGLLLLITPDWSDWGVAFGSRSIQRLKRILYQSKSIVHIREGGSVSWPVFHYENDAASPRKGDANCLTQDQEKVVSAILKVVTGHRRRPLVIQSDRGRGKTAALGIALAHLLKHPPETGKKTTFIITAPLRANVDAAFQQLALHVSEAEHSASAVRLGHSEVVYLPPDSIIADQPKAALLLVDEAAAIPEPILSQLLDQYSRIAFATTLHGYEGSGRGFEIRFKQQLDRKTPQWHCSTMTSPIRWGKDDPLEQLIFDVLLLNAGFSDIDSDGVRTEAASVQWLDRDKLVNDEAILNAIFGLLVLAHYQTRPEDLTLILDEPSVHVAALFGQAPSKTLLGVMLCIEEGDEQDEDLIGQVVQGRRRPKGHLIPQALASQSGLAQAMPLAYLRVMRIAVHPEVQGRGLGTQMLQSLIRHPPSYLELDMLATSFGATPALVRFWQQLGFQVARLGVHRDAASGEQAVMMLHPLSGQGRDICERVQQAFYPSFVHGLPEFFVNTSPNIIRQLMLNPPPACHKAFELSASDQEAVEYYAFHFRPYETVLLSLSTWTVSRLMRGELGNQDADMLIARVLQRKSWHDVASVYGLTGRKQVEKRLKAILQKQLLDM